MTPVDIKPGDQLYPVPRTLAAPGICYRSTPETVTVTGFGIGDIVEVVELDGTAHRIHAADLSRTRPRAVARSMVRNPYPSPEPMEISGVTYEEIPLF